MRRKGSLSRMVAASGFLALIAAQAHAGSFEVAPTTISMGSSEPAVFYIINNSEQPIIAQVEGFAWRQTDTDLLEDTGALVISPPMMRILPRQQQTIRLMARPGANAATERSFRLVVSEIPDPLVPPDPGKINMLLQFSVPVFIGSGKDAATLVSWSARLTPGGLLLTARNTGQKHAKISGVTLETPLGQKLSPADGKFRYILAGNSSSWVISQPALAAGEAVHLKAFDDTTNTPIDAPLLIQ